MHLVLAHLFVPTPALSLVPMLVTQHFVRQAAELDWLNSAGGNEALANSISEQDLRNVRIHRMAFIR